MSRTVTLTVERFTDPDWEYEIKIDEPTLTVVTKNDPDRGRDLDSVVFVNDSAYGLVVAMDDENNPFTRDRYEIPANQQEPALFRTLVFQRTYSYGVSAVEKPNIKPGSADIDVVADTEP